MSARDTDAAMTIAASVGWGRLLSRPGTATSMSTIRPAPTTPVSWVLAPPRPPRAAARRARGRGAWAPPRVAPRRARAARAHREALEQARGHVRRPDADHLAV